MPPTTSGVKAACSWTTGDTTELMEADCDDAEGQLNVRSVSFVKLPVQAMAEGAVCRDVEGEEPKEGEIEGYLKANCGENYLNEDSTKIDEDKTAKVQVASCIRDDKNDTTD